MASAATIKSLSFVKKYGNDMFLALNGTRLFFPIMLIQAVNESWYGTSYSAVHRNNFFGIKNPNNKGMRVFNTPQDCFSYYANLLTTSSRYVNAGVNSASDPYAQMRSIANAGYYDANDDTGNLPALQLPPNKIWTAQQSADRYYNLNKILLDEILLNLKVGIINNSNLAQAQTQLANLNSII
jgi:hypothetical protein